MNAFLISNRSNCSSYYWAWYRSSNSGPK